MLKFWAVENRKNPCYFFSKKDRDNWINQAKDKRRLITSAESQRERKKINAYKAKY